MSAIPPKKIVVREKIRINEGNNMFGILRIVDSCIKQQSVLIIVSLALIYFFTIPLQVQAQPRYFNAYGKETDKLEEAVFWLTGSLTIVTQPSGISKARFVDGFMSAEQFVALVQRATAQWENTGMGLKILVEVDLVSEPSLGNYRLEVGWASTSRIRSVNEQRTQSKKLKKQLKRRAAGVLGTCVPCNLPGIAESDVFLNYEYESGWTEELLYRVLVHEIGHLLGLSHTPDNKTSCGSSIMYPDPHLLDSANQRSLGSSEAKVCMSFTQHDVEAIKALYPSDDWSLINPIKRTSPDNAAPTIMASGTVKEFEECWAGTGNMESFKRKTKTVYHWLMLSQYTGTHLLERRWYDSNGYLVMQDVEAIEESEQSIIPSEPSVRCAALFFAVPITPLIEPIPGRWRIDVYIDGALARQDYFEIDGKPSTAPPLSPHKDPVPHITPVELPDVVKELEGGVWIFRFEDGDKDIENVVIEFLNPQGEWEPKAYADFYGYTVRVAGAAEGMIYVTSGCWRTYAETVGKIIERIKIIDRAGHQSEPIQYSYSCVSERLEAFGKGQGQTRPIPEPVASSADGRPISIDIFDLQGAAVASGVRIEALSNQFKNELKRLVPGSLANGVYIVVVTIQSLEGVRREVHKIVVLR